MKVLSWEELAAGELSGRAFAATIGVFDGLHIGHRELVKRIIGKAGLSSLVLTFEENPKRILSPSTYHGELSTLDQKLALVGSMGVDNCALIDFSGDFSKLPGRRFLSMLRESFEFRFLAVGADFRCGRGLDTNSEGIRSFCAEHSIGIELIPAVQWAGQGVSSSRIRKAIVDGRLEEAISMLGRRYEIDLRASSLSPSGTIKPKGEQASPPPGIYEAALAFGEDALSAELPVTARLDAEGAWSIAGMADGGRPEGLRLTRLVSRG